jgi:hypothetical protein
MAEIRQLDFVAVRLRLHQDCGHLREWNSMKFGSIVAHPMPVPTMYNTIN